MAGRRIEFSKSPKTGIADITSAHSMWVNLSRGDCRLAAARACMQDFLFLFSSSFLSYLSQTLKVISMKQEEEKSMAIRYFTDMVNGRQRLIAILDDPTEDERARFNMLVGTDTVAHSLPSTNSILPVEVDPVKVVWGDDTEASLQLSLIRDAIKKLQWKPDWTYDNYKTALCADSASIMLVNISAMYRFFQEKKIPVPQEFIRATVMWLNKIKGSQSLREHAKTCLMSMPDLVSPFLDNLRKESGAVVFGDWFDRQSEEERGRIAQEGIDSVVKALSQIPQMQNK